MMGSWKKVFWSLLMVGLTVAPVWSGPLSLEEVPEPLKPWISWSLDGREEAVCPSSYNASGEFWCRWPGELVLELDNRGGKFTQAWELFIPSRVPLPAAERHGPQEVRANGKPATVTFRDGAPSVFLPAGKHRLEGRFSWDRLPDALAVPAAAGLIRLVVEGKKAAPRIGKDGRLWLRAGQDREAVLEDRLQIQVFRKLTDEIPVVLTTRLVLDVSGRSREVVLGKALPAGFLAASLQSPLPIRLEADGRPRIQARPGRWAVEIIARHQGPLTRLTMEHPQESWPGEEIWSFEARPHLRLVSPVGLTPIDPKQTQLPGAWSAFPAFLIRPQETLTLTEKRRGDPEPAPDQLALQRTLWLDFNGCGFTMQDHITGSMTRGWRLQLLPPADLGRVAIDGVDRFITRDEEGSGAGVEVRRGHLNLVADSRLEKRGGTLSATGWNADFVSVQTTLNLPPGYRLLYAAGADAVPGTWFSQWSLFDLFVVLLIALAAGRIRGWPCAVLALLALALSYHEPGAPRWVWLHLLAAVALVRVLPAGRARTAAGLYRNVALAALLLFFLPFAVHQIRSGIFPQLELEYGSFGPSRRVKPALVSMKNQSPELIGEAMDAGAARPAGAPARSSLPQMKKAEEPLLFHDPDAKVQTGPGLPQWRWRSIPIRWNGPVKASQTLQLIFLSPAVNLLLSFLRVALVGFLICLFLDLRKGGEGKWRLVPRAGWLPLLAFGLAMGPVPASAAIPGPEILEQLQKRLLEPAECFPHCAEIHSLDVAFTADRLSLDMVVHAEAHVAVPLPGARDQWIPDRVSRNGQPVPLHLDAAGRLWTAVTPGRHRLTLEGLLPPHEALVLPLPLAPRQVAFSGRGWEVAGLDGAWPPQQLQLRRLAGTGEKQSAFLEPATLAPFFRVERTLKLGLQWKVDTRVIRLFGDGSATVIRVPLLPGEAVTSEGIATADGSVTLNIPAGVNQIAWNSVLDIAPRLNLKAVSAEQWSESWKLDVSPIWHVEWQGISVIHHQDSAGNWLPEWRPWPGEEVHLLISRPQGVGGQTLTIDDSALTIKPGKRATEASLKLQLRSSQGGEQALTLPEQAELQGVFIDGRPQPIRQEGRQVTLPLTPGKREIDLSWMTPQGVVSLYHTPLVNLGTASVNGRIHLEMPGDRWVLFAGGPRLGPAVLFWGVLLLLVPIAFGLGWSALTPLKFHHWLLLGIGLTQLEAVNALVVVGWLLALGVRSWLTLDDRDWAFNFMQIGLAIWTGFALLSLLVSVQQGLLGFPHMQIAGNGSSASRLLWYQDRAAEILPQAWVLSVPMMVYRLLMLAWALWLAMALLRWLQWGWEAFSRGGLWRPVKIRRMLKEKEKP